MTAYHLPPFVKSGKGEKGDPGQTGGVGVGTTNITNVTNVTNVTDVHTGTETHDTTSLHGAWHLYPDAIAITAKQIAVKSATVAATGSTQSDAALIDVGFTLVSAADGTKGVKLPDAREGRNCWIKNNVAASLKVWPTSGDAINAIAANSNFSIGNLMACQFTAYDETTWYTTPLVAS